MWSDGASGDEVPGIDCGHNLKDGHETVHERSGKSRERKEKRKGRGRGKRGTSIAEDDEEEEETKLFDETSGIAGLGSSEKR